MTQETLSQVFQHAINANRRRDPLDVLKGIGEQWGIEHFTYFQRPHCKADSAGDGIIRTTYPNAWSKHYLENDYHLVDPVVTQGLNSILPLDWDHLPRQSRIIRNFFGEAQEFGIKPRGITVPIHDPDGRRAIFSINTDLEKCDWRRFRDRFLPELQYLGSLLHYSIKQHESPNGFPIAIPQLRAREIEALQWAALGKTSWETSMIMGVAKRTIDFYIKNACMTLNVANKTQAVAKCVFFGIITHE